MTYSTSAVILRSSNKRSPINNGTFNCSLIVCLSYHRLILINPISDKMV
nr:MAG TPA: hypothetical protein [Caudoviricetes sp.]